MIDAHLHLWDLATGEYGWNTPALGALHASFRADDAERALDSAGVRSALLVQAADTVGDTERMLAVAESRTWVAGVVAWMPLDEPAIAEATLDGWRNRPVSGVRALLHENPDPDFLDRPTVRRSLALLAERGLPFDVPDAWPRLWPALTRLVQELPELTVVVDHLGKPDLDAVRASAADTAAAIDRWRADLRSLAVFPQVVAKLSGFAGWVRGEVPLTACSIAPVVDDALEAFTPGRLLFGSDWPVSLPGGRYRDTVSAAVGALQKLGREDFDAITSSTAERVYSLVPR